MIVGALIIKHQMNLSDRETIDLIQENPYVQYFVGLHDFSNIPVFDASLFVYIRKRLGVENMNAITILLMNSLGGQSRTTIDNEAVESQDEDLSSNKEEDPETSGRQEEESFTNPETLTIYPLAS